MDSASSSLAYASRDGAAPDDDASLLVAAGQAKEAALLFQVGKFVDCLRILNQLLHKKDDLRVRHNIAIAQNIQDGCSDPKKLIEVLEIIKRRIEELAHASGEPMAVTSNDGRKHVASMKETNSTEHPMSSSSSIYTGEYDTSVVMFNIAVVWFHFHKYEKAFLYLDTLYQNIEPIDEGTALRVCLLLLDVALLSNHAPRSADVISYMEKAFCANSLTNQIDNGTQPQSFIVPKSAPPPSNSALTDSSHADSLVTADALDNSLTRSLSEEALDELSLLSSLDIGGQSLQRSFDAVSSNDIPRSQVEEPLSVIDLRLKVHLYKVRFLLLTRNLKAAKREVKMAMNLAHGKDYSMALYLKSQLEYARRNYLKAIKLLMASSNLKETGVAITYFNNLGCIYYQLGKHHSSGVFFSKALNSSLEQKEKTPKLVTMTQDKSLLLSYNCGMHYLACGRPYHAAQCFRKASLIFHNRPLLWLRIAECCLMAQEKGATKSNSSFEKHEVRVDVVGRGKWRQLAVRNGTSPNGQWENVQKDNFLPGDGKQIVLSMALARQCLVNALHLLESYEEKHSAYGSSQTVTEKASRETLLSQRTGHKAATLGDDTKDPNAARVSIQSNSNGEVKEQKGGNALSALFRNSIADYESILANEIQMMKQATVADLAYVELVLGNPLKALTTAKSLLKLPECSRIYTFLGTIYIAEALCLLNKPKEAAEYLMIYVSRGNNVELPYSREDCENWKVAKVVDNNEDAGAGTIAGELQVSTFFSPDVACGIFCVNYAANFALLGDLDQADHFLRKALSDMPNSPQAILTAIYLDLKRGKMQEAVAKLKQHSAIRFIPGSVKC